MELYLTNTAHGLIPSYSDDYEEKRKLKIGVTYKAKITVPRNLNFHRKYFSLINCAWEYQSEVRQEKLFKNSVDLFRKTVEITAGHCDTIWSTRLKEFVEIPKSIAFDKMDDAEFSDLYERVKDVLFSTFLTHINEGEFMNNLINY